MAGQMSEFIEAAVRAAFQVECLQQPDELRELAALILERKLFRVLEIGWWRGGTRNFFEALGCTVWTIDRQSSYEFPASNFIPGDSHTEAVQAKAREHGPYDLVFVDGDHRMASVLADAKDYHPMVAPGGIIAFHDVRSQAYDIDCEAWWATVPEPKRLIWSHGPWGGIGILEAT